MPARIHKIRHDDNTRNKIRATYIVNRLTKCFAGKLDLKPTQIRCGEILLDRVLPKLQLVENKGDTTKVYVAVLPSPSTSVKEWLEQNQPKVIEHAPQKEHK